MLIQSKKIWIADQFIAAIIATENGKITDILPYGSKPVDVDYGDKRIVPGFLDIHCHGAFEFDTNDANEEGSDSICVGTLHRTWNCERLFFCAGDRTYKSSNWLFYGTKQCVARTDGIVR